MKEPSTPHFKAWEFNCPQAGKVPRRYWPNLRKLQAALEQIRERRGCPCRILSGWRSLAYNRKNKGRASKSLHLSAQAADIRGGAALFWLIQDLMDMGLIPKGGLALYHAGTRRQFVHYDIRGWPARWKKTPPKPRRVR